VATPIEEDVPSADQLTTSTKSVADYFKEKLRARLGSTITTASTLSDDDAPHIKAGLGSSLFAAQTGIETDGNSQFIGSVKPTSIFPSFSAASKLVMPSLDNSGPEDSGAEHSETYDTDAERTHERKKNKKDIGSDELPKKKTKKRKHADPHWELESSEGKGEKKRKKKAPKDRE
jgi:Pin2-interacting protein X1